MFSFSEHMRVEMTTCSKDDVECLAQSKTTTPLPAVAVAITEPPLPVVAVAITEPPAVKETTHRAETGKEDMSWYMHFHLTFCSVFHQIEAYI